MQHLSVVQLPTNILYNCGVVHVQLLGVLQRLGLQKLRLPVLIPGGRGSMVPVAPALTPSDEKAVDNVMQLTNFLTGGKAESLGPSLFSPSMAQEVGFLLSVV